MAEIRSTRGSSLGRAQGAVADLEPNEFSIKDQSREFRYVGSSEIGWRSRACSIVPFGMAAESISIWPVPSSWNAPPRSYMRIRGVNGSGRFGSGILASWRAAKFRLHLIVPKTTGCCSSTLLMRVAKPSWSATCSELKWLATSKNGQTCELVWRAQIAERCMYSRMSATRERVRLKSPDQSTDSSRVVRACTADSVMAYYSECRKSGRPNLTGQGEARTEVGTFRVSAMRYRDSRDARVGKYRERHSVLWCTS